jgi:hypothetical protein
MLLEEGGTFDPQDIEKENHYYLNSQITHENINVPFIR